MSEQWERINPYYAEQWKTDEFYGKNLISLLDEVLNNAVNKYENEFIHDIQDYCCFSRARKWEWSNLSDLEPPTVKVALEKNIINRWNPPNKRYLYLAASQNDIKPDEVCLAEMRAEEGAVYSIVDFEATSAKKKRLLLLDYEDITYEDLDSHVDDMMKNIVDEAVTNIKVNFSLSKLDDRIDQEVEKSKSNIQQLATIHCAKLFFKTLCQTVFIPLDKDEDEDKALKDKCYKSFHVLAQYLEGKGYDGIIYPSTRMKLKNGHGINVVLFNCDVMQPIEGTLRIVKKE